jgi:hypothetical protein
MLFLALLLLAAPPKMTRAEYEDRVRAAWTAQVLGANMGFAFEHKPAAAAWVDTLPAKWPGFAPVDDDYYYEIVALRAFEKYGPKMTVQDLGRQWKENAAGSWGSSEQTRLLLQKGIEPPDTGHPRYNKLWFTIGPQFSADIYGMLAPGRPLVAAKLARELGHINGYAEGTDGGIFVAGMVSYAFVETDPKQVVRKAAQLIPPSSPYRQCLDLVIRLADSGKSAGEVANAVEDRWHIEYPATNNAVANGGIVALSVWFGEGDLLKTLNTAFAAADFTDADCNAANAGSVVGAMRGMKGIPRELADHLGDRIRGDKMGGVTLTPPVDESITDLALRTVRMGERMLRLMDPPPLAAETFSLSDLTKYWNPSWRLERAGFGGAGGGLGGLRGITYLDGDVLATYPRDEVRGVVLSTETDLTGPHRLRVDVGTDAGRAWRLDVYAGNQRIFSELIDTPWRTVDLPVTPMGGKATLRLYQLVLNPGKQPGIAYWRNPRID